MPFNMFGEDQSGYIPDNNMIGQFSMPQIDPYQQMASQVVIEKKKKKWLDEMAERLAGDRYYGTNEVDRKRAAGSAMIEMSKQFQEAASKGSWGAFASAVGNSLPTASSSFDKSMSVAQEQRELNRAQQYTTQKRALDIEDSTIGIENAKLNRESNKIELSNQQKKQAIDARYEESSPNIIESLDRDFNEIIGKADITDGMRKSAKSGWQAIATSAANDPTNPQRMLDAADFILKLGGESDVTEAAARKYRTLLEQEAGKTGMTVPEYLKFNKLRANNMLVQDNLSNELTRSSIDENTAQRAKYEAEAENLDGGVPKTHLASYNMVKGALKDLEKDDDFFDTVELIMGGEPVELTGSMKAKLKLYGVDPRNPKTAQDFFSNFMLPNRDNYIKKLIGLGETDPSMLGGTDIDMTDPVAISKFISSLSPEERQFFLRGSAQ